MVVSIVLITYNSEYYIEQCLSSLFFSTNQRRNEHIEVFTVDNDSSDKTLLVIQKNFPQIKIIKNKKNIGFAAAANQGAKIAKGKYLLFLNPDTVVKAGCIEEMVNFLKKKKDAAVVGCKVLNPDGSLQPSCGNFPTIVNIILDRIPLINKLFKTQLIRQEDFYSREQTPDWISGVFFMVRKDIFEKLGGFDEKYFMYVEDIDFCYRARRAGFNIYYNPKAEIIHYDMGKSKERKYQKAINMRKGFTIFFKKYRYTYSGLWKFLIKVESNVRTVLNINIYYLVFILIGILLLGFLFFAFSHTFINIIIQMAESKSFSSGNIIHTYEKNLVH